MERLPAMIHESWHQYLQPLFDDHKMLILRDKILPNCKFYPAPPQIFRVFSMPLDQIKVVIIGQDPYPNGEANGLAFAVNENRGTPPSLNVIYKEIQKEELPINFDVANWKTLKHWESQGIFLLNTALTVEAKSPSSHTGYWQWFTKQVIRTISLNNPCVWLLWGAKAQALRDYISNSYNGIRPKSEVDSGYQPDPEVIKMVNIYFEATHPAAETYSKGSGKIFTGCNHFKLCNEALQKKQKSIINW